MLRSGSCDNGQSNLPQLRQLPKKSNHAKKARAEALREKDFDKRPQPKAAMLSPYKAKTGVILPLAACLLPFAGVATPIAASAQTSVLGVVKSDDNNRQWSGITQRLSVSGVAYCVVDLQQVKRGADLGSTRVLFLPNIETLTATQLQALQEWMGKGGRVIVTGPTGTLSQPAVRTSLRSLLGAYWGFAVTTPSTVRPMGTSKPGGRPAPSETWAGQNGLTGNVRGGVVIPASITSQTAATWKSSEVNNLPAVVATNQSVFLGWRWGIDAVSSVELDSAWLRAALNRYGVRAAGRNAPGNEQSCTSSPTVANQPASSASPATRASAAPPLTGWSEVTAPIPTETSTATPPVARVYRQPASQTGQTPTPEGGRQVTSHLAPPSPATLIPQSPLFTTQDVPIAPARLDVKPGSQPIAPKQVIAMREELENLIGRFESALLAGNATAQATTSPPLVRVEKQEPRGGEVPSSNQKEKQEQESSLLPSQRVVTDAKNSLQKFIQLVGQQNYADARQQWLQTRRSLWDNYPTDGKIAQPEIRAVWLDRGTIVTARSARDLAKIFDSLAAAGINTVFFETVNAGYPIYPSRIAPAQNPLSRGWDPLEAAVQLAHERGIELHAWVWIFAAGNQRHNALLNLPQNYPGPLIAAHPDWAAYNNQGRMFDLRSGKVFLDPANPEVRSYLWDILEEIATKYKVDGIHLDYIRYPFQDPGGKQTWGYGKAAREAYKQMTGLDPLSISPNNSSLWQEWTNFRIRQIDSFVATASQRLHAKRPELILSAAVFPLPTQERLQKLQQNWEDWALRGDVDLVVPMTYALETNQLQQLAQPWLSSVALASTLILPGIRLLNLPDPVAVDQIQLLRDLPGAGGYSLFAFENISDRLYKIFGRTQGALGQTSPAPVPYRQPFKAAAARYGALQREWNFLLANKQLSLEEAARGELSKRSEELGTALNQLAAEPSTTHLAAAKASLSSFRAQFRQWMQTQASEQPYLVQTWDNRLATLERLLGYGERVVLNRKVKSN